MFFTRAPRLNSASYGAASREPKWPAKSDWKIFLLTPCRGVSIRCAAPPQWDRAEITTVQNNNVRTIESKTGRAEEGRIPHPAGHLQYEAAAVPRQAESGLCQPFHARPAGTFTLAALNSRKSCKFCHPASLRFALTHAQALAPLERVLA